MNVMLKIKSLKAASKAPSPPLPDTPLRNALSRVSQNGSGLKNLSQERDLKKMEKQREPSSDKSELNDM